MGADVGGVVRSKVISLKFVQFSKASSPILATLSGIVTEIRPLQPENLQVALYQRFEV